MKRSICIINDSVGFRLYPDSAIVKTGCGYRMSADVGYTVNNFARNLESSVQPGRAYFQYLAACIFKIGYFPEKVFTLEASFVNTQVRLG